MAEAGETRWRFGGLVEARGKRYHEIKSIGPKLHEKWGAKVDVTGRYFFSETIGNRDGQAKAIILQ